jgi:hypothetical protein
MAQARLTVDQIENALNAKAGNISEAAKAMGVSRSTFHRRISESPRLQEVLSDAREAMVDIAESALKREVLNGNIAAIIFTLKTQGKQRGYVEKLEIDVRYITIIQQIEQASARLGISASDALNDFYHELSAASVSQDTSAE